MLTPIISFEISYNLRNPVFWVSVAIFFLMGFGIASSEAVSLGMPDSIHVNSPYAIAIALAIMSLFYLFVVTAFCASAIVRDEQSGFSPVIRGTGVSRRTLLLGRFIGGLAIAYLGFAAIPLGMAVGSLMPWVDPETVGPHIFANYAWHYLLFAVPNIFLTAALLYSFAAWTRSMMGAYLGAVGLVTIYFIATGSVGQDMASRLLFARFEPLGLGALSEVTRYWTQVELNSRLIPLSGDMLFNRVFAILLGFIVLAIAAWRFKLGEKPMSRRKARKAEKAAVKAARIEAVPPTLGGDKIVAGQARANRLVQFISRTRIEMRQVLTSPGLIILTLFAVVDISSILWMGNTTYGTPNHPTVAATIETVQLNFTVIILMIAAFYGGELVWRERDREISEIIDSTPVPSWIMTVPKVLALFLVLLLVNIAAMATGLFYQLANGAEEYGIAGYFNWFIIPYAVDLLLIAVLAVFFQVLSPSKYVGWGLLLSWFVLGVFMEAVGLVNPLYSYSASSEVPLSDFQGSGSFSWGSTVMQFYWAMAAFILMAMAHLIWPRGTDLSLRVRLKQAWRRPKAIPLSIATFAAIGMIASGLYIHHNVYELNRFTTRQDDVSRRADYEKKYLRYADLPQPSIRDARIDVQLFPQKRRMLVEGSYTLENMQSSAIAELHVRSGIEDIVWHRMTVPGAELTLDDKEFGYRIYRFGEPLKPGETVRIDFSSELWRKGFAAIPHIDVIENGTFLNNRQFAPIIGMDRDGLLTDRSDRRGEGLPSQLRKKKLEDMAAARKAMGSNNWINLDITVSTDADQIPIAPGKKVSDDVRFGRRTARFVSDAPILDFFSIQSARYALEERDHDGVALEVFYHPSHRWNVGKMLDAMETSLDYFGEAFGPYQFDYARIIEFPRYRSFAQAFAGTIPYSESVGFVADTDDPEYIDFTTYFVAHELAHQYFAHQAMGADMQGGTLTTETLSQYGALMIMKKMHGPDKIRRFLKYELDRYLAGRQTSVIEELPLSRVENQPFIYYNKGTLAMYLLQEEMGEEAVNRALKRYLDKYRYVGPPYPRSLDVIAELKAEATSEAQLKLIEDLFERIVIYDLKARDAVSKKVGENWETTFTVEAAKYEADGHGVEKAVDLHEDIHVGLFAKRPGLGAFQAGDVIEMKKLPLRSGKQTIRLRSARKPEFVGVDPYNYRIDRDSDDNIVELGSD